MDPRSIAGAALLALLISAFATALSFLPARPGADREPDPAWHDGRPPARPTPAAAPDEPSIPTRRSRWDTGAPAEDPTTDWI